MNRIGGGNPPPLGGSCVITPNTGFAMDTIFHLGCNGWTDPEGHDILYQVKYRIVGSEDIIALTGFSYVSNFNLILPEGDLQLMVIVSDIYGSKSSFSLGVQVDAYVPPNIEPIADANGPYLGATRTAIGFDASASTDPDGDVLTYDWDWGDDSIISDAGPTPTHTYAESGIYDVCLTVTDHFGASDTACTDAVIYDPAGGFVTGGDGSTHPPVPTTSRISPSTIGATTSWWTLRPLHGPMLVLSQKR